MRFIKESFKITIMQSTNGLKIKTSYIYTNVRSVSRLFWKIFYKKDLQFFLKNIYSKIIEVQVETLHFLMKSLTK